MKCFLQRLVFKETSPTVIVNLINKRRPLPIILPLIVLQLSFCRKQIVPSSGYIWQLQIKKK